MSSILFLMFSILTAFSNILIGEYQYCIFIIPFVFSIVAGRKLSAIFEIIGLFIIATYLIYCQDISIGIMVMMVSSILFFGVTEKEKIIYTKIILCSIVIFIASFFNIKNTESIIVRSTMNSIIYIIGVIAVYNRFTIYRHRARRAGEGIEQRYLNVLDELMSVAHDSIEALKKMQGGPK